MFQLSVSGKHISSHKVNKETGLCLQTDFCEIYYYSENQYSELLMAEIEGRNM